MFRMVRLLTTWSCPTCTDTKPLQFYGIMTVIKRPEQQNRCKELPGIVINM